MPLRKIDPTPSAYSYPLLIKNLLETPLIHAPNQEIVYRDKLRYDYRTLRNRISQLANTLERLGVKQGDTVAVMDWDSHRYLECFFAIPMMGAVLHTINIRLSPEQLVYTINHAEDNIILANADFLPLLEAVKDQFATVRKIILLNDSDNLPETTLTLEGEYEDLISGNSSDYDFPDFDENGLATTFYTTGTTGLPKGVYFSHRQLVLHTFGVITAVCGFNSQLSLDSGDVYMPLTPMFHVHAWGLPYVSTLLGVKQVYPGRYEPEFILYLIQSEKVTFSHCVPTVLHMIINNPAAKKTDLSCWKLIVGGSAFPKSLCKTVSDLGINVFTGYGMSETGPVLTLSHLKPHMREWDKDRQAEMRIRAGLPIPLVHLRILDEEGNDQPHDGSSMGEIVVRAPWLTQGYLKDPEMTEDLWAGGWLHTGDIAVIDPEAGYLQITDRVKDVIKTGGEWISSLTLENIITQHEAVSEAAAIGIPDDKWVERPVIYVVLREGYEGKVTEDELKAFFMTFVENGTIPKYGMPDKIIFTESIPKTSVGKIDKKTIRKEHR